VIGGEEWSFKMIGTVARKEIISNLVSYKFFIVILLTSVLIFTSFFIMHRDYKQRLSDYHIIKPKPNEPIAVIPPNPLSMFANGLEDAMTRSFEVSRIGVETRAGQSSGNIIFSFFTSPDFLYIVRVVLSLVALLFGFDQISREKEQGTLRLMLANSIPRSKMLAGKWIGNFLSLSIPFLLVTLLGFALLNLDSDIYFSPGNLVRFVFMLAVTLIYMALFLSLGIFISTLTKKAASSIVILLFIWALFVFVIPNLGTLLARKMVDVPSVRALSEKKEQIWTREVLLRIMDGREGKKTGVSRFQAIHNEMDKLEEDYRNKFNRLIGLSKNINRISPVASFIYALTDIAGTGIGEEGHFKTEIIRYKNRAFLDIVSDNAEYSPFNYQYRSLSQILAKGTLFDIAWLVFFNIFFFALSYFSFVKYDVR
jgi:ABC-type transport system involved in multi-copper enzyme maturation permease subunit